MKYILSPEFHRNLWLRFSPLRLAAAPLTLALCALACANVPAEGGNALGPDWMHTLMNVALCVYFLVVVVWGTYEAAGSLQEEVRGNTWDFQRMSSISPLKLVLGKLFGSTSYTWYFGLVALSVFGYAYHNFQMPSGAESGFKMHGLPPSSGMDGAADMASHLPVPADDTLYVMLYLVLAGLIGQALAFLHALIDMTAFVPSTGRQRVPRAIGAFIVGLLVAVFAFSMALSSAVHLKPVVASLFFHSFFVNWYGHDFDHDLFQVCSLVFFLGWFLVGSYRVACAELMYRVTPLVWMLFVVTYTVWCCGFLSTPDMGADIELERRAALSHMLLGGFVQALVLCYVTMLMEASDGRKYERFGFYLKARDLRRAFENMPKWIATAPIVLVLYIAALVYAPDSDHGYRLDTVHLAFLMTSGILFLLRDGCVVHSIFQALSGRRVGSAILFYYLLAYGLLPFAAFKPLQIDLTQVARSMASLNIPVDVARAIGLFYPSPYADPLVSLMPAALELAAAAFLLHRLLRRNRKKREAGDVKKNG